VPSTPPLQFVAPPGGALQIPDVCPEPITQMPLQQSPGRTHTSFVWMQKEAPRTQLPLLQSFEQHWLLSVQPLPAVLQAVVRG
jgi:hypothetical protein